jgi:tetratricopeptide (TPR) repeat protein
VRAGRKESVRQLSRAISLQERSANALNSKYTIAYLLRAIVNESLGDYSSALADYNQALTLNRRLVGIYINRGNLKDKLNDRPGAIQDFQAAARLFRQQGRTTERQTVIELLRALGATE